MFQEIITLQNPTIHNLQEVYAKLRKDSEGTNRRQNQVLQDQHHCKRNRKFLDQDISNLFNFCQNIQLQKQGNVLDNTPYHQEEIKPNAFFENIPRSSSHYQDVYDITYSEKEALKQIPESSSWPKFSGIGEYAHMELIYYIDGLFIDVSSIPDNWIKSRVNTESK
ncbi:hypothetical protein O181_033504 [Austropuccinia psidii MF-1]|uniref:Uncharacterized protein n=1 Tax=Austropuccinia psidii MF-1 TaxID=1389203 RepID=A0A9Q3CZB6_9BASI|nr:hypothetical protein [Austropuccinia psidii MF-1]